MHVLVSFAAVSAATWSVALAANQGPDPADAGSPVPLIRYESPFNDFAGRRDPQPDAWRKLNDEVGRVGGHAGYLKEPAPSGSPARSHGRDGAAAVAPAPGNVSGHHNHGK